MAKFAKTLKKIKWKLQSIRRWIHDSWYYTKCVIWHPYNVVRIKSLPPTWNDRDDVLLHASFQIFEDFVNKEKPYIFTATEEEIMKDYGPSYGPQRWQNHCIMVELFDWWQEYKNVNEGYNDKIYKKEDDMLQKLISIRSELWT